MFSIVKEKKTRFFLEDVEESPMVRNPRRRVREASEGALGGWPGAALDLGLVPQGHTLVKPIKLYRYNLRLFYMYLHFNKKF